MKSAHDVCAEPALTTRPVGVRALPRFSFASLRVRLLFLVLLATLPGFGLTFYSAWADRHRAARDVRENTLQVARLASASQEQLIEGVHQVLVTLTRLPEVRDGDSAACSALLGDLLKQYPFYALLGVARQDGNVVCSAVPLSDPVTIADRPYFRRALEQRDFAIGEYQIDRVTNRATLNFGHPVLDETGRVRAVVFVALDLGWLNQLVAQTQLPPGATFTVIDRNGTILARFPDPDRLVGETVPEAPIVDAIRARRGESTIRLPGLDGVRRLFAFTPLHAEPEDGGLYISVGIPTSVAYAEVNKLLIGNLLGLALAAMLALEAARRGGNAFILRPVKALVAATNRLSAGDLSTRTGLSYDGGEFGHLARAFDDMAGALQTREAERAL
ncbi:MAG TPA: PAS domain S-box protein, partial [Chloroflexi bacterium]|nr:PAS domain S-box protein [Chloroflexota bacterium]